jgi:hypothetical protein
VCVCIYIYIDIYILYIYIYIHTHTYIHTYTKRERERKRAHGTGHDRTTQWLPLALNDERQHPGIHTSRAEIQATLHAVSSLAKH